MENFRNDSLGFEKFVIDELIVSLLSQLSGEYVRLVMKAKKSDLADHALKYHARFNEISKAKRSLYALTYSQKVEDIKKYELELKQVLALEEAA